METAHEFFIHELGDMLDAERQLVEALEQRGEHLQPEYHRATPECPHPERWHLLDGMTAQFGDQRIKNVLLVIAQIS